MDKKVIDNIVWWIPFKSLRNKIRNKLVKEYVTNIRTYRFSFGRSL